MAAAAFALTACKKNHNDAAPFTYPNMAEAAIINPPSR